MLNIPDPSAHQDSGYHSFHDEYGREHGCFQVFYHNPRQRHYGDSPSADCDEGWYWFACFPGCLPDGDPTGPFLTSRDAREDADAFCPVETVEQEEA